MRRRKLLCLEQLGMVQEAADSGYSVSFASSGSAEVPPSDDPLEDEKLRSYMIRKAHAEAIARERRTQRLRKLARMDFKMVGGVSPIGFYGGGSTGGAGGRPGSMSART